MSQPMTPIELIASAFTIIASFGLFWWGAKNLIAMAVDLYERCRPMREKNQEGE